MKTALGLAAFITLWSFAHCDASQKDNLATKTASAIVVTK